MFNRSQRPKGVTLFLALVFGWITSTALAQQTPNDPASPRFKVVEASQRLEMIVNSSRILEMDFRVPRLIVNNPEVVQATPLSPNEVQVSALKPGVTNLNLWDENGKIHTVDILVMGDARELAALLQSQFPDASLKVTPLSTNVVISGFVPSADDVSRVISIAEDYYPAVINNITVGGAQTVLLQVKVYEVSRTKLRKMGFDWALFTDGNAFVQNVSGLVQNFTVNPGTVTSAVGPGGPNFAFGIVGSNTSFVGLLEALRQYNMVRVLAEPNLVAVSGRPARFLSGGEFPILIPQSMGTVSVQFKQFGTQVDFVPIVLGNGFLRLEVRPEVSEIDPARSVVLGNITVPALRTRTVDTSVEMRAGQTLALAGLIQTRAEAQNRGLPWLSDLPWVGAAFRRVEEQQNEIELLILVTPEFVDAADAHEVPKCLPGQAAGSPTDIELYWKGYLEVPRCCDDGSCGRHDQPEQLATPPENIGPAPARPVSSAKPADSRQAAPPASRANAGRTLTDEPPALIGPVGYQPLK